MKCEKCSSSKKRTSAYSRLGEAGDSAREALQKFGVTVKPRGLIQRLRDRIKKRKVTIKELKEKMEVTKGVEPKRRRLFNREGGFFSEERTAKRRDFRIKVSSNRKWIMIGVAIVAVCGTIIYLSVTYGGGGFGFVTKLLGAFK